ncbi:MAG: hypothetical protein J5616_07480 [Bacteroidaceae bacterium]|nr:hypothetical protein [Bacteroidaceae bacterium]
MNIKHLFLAAASLTVFAACSEYDPGLADNVLDYTDEELATIKEYEENFIRRYGAIDSEHTWGFGELGSEDEASLETRSINVNRNNWVLRTDNPAYDENGNIIKNSDGSDGRVIEWVVNTTELPEGTEIPGFPSYLGGYYTEEGIFESIDAIEAAGLRAVHPIGDVTKEEILQVSQWFRTHKNPEPAEFNYSRIFFQEISQDVDRIASNPDEGEWDALYDEADENGEKWICNYGMDYLCVKGAGYSDWEHINNYNNYSEEIDENGNYIGNHIAEENPNSGQQDLSNRKIKYWTSNDGTTAIDFAYHGSHDDAIHNEWVICKVPYTINGTTYYGYYLAFDYEMDKTGKGGGKVYCDGYYSNWIIKLAQGAPSEEQNDHQWYRIMCEDLGSTYDYDFNDVVFDVYFTGNSAEGYVANIHVKAAGGVFPIFIGQHDNNHEAHRLLGRVDTYNSTTNRYLPINVGGQTGVHNGILQVPVDITNPDIIPIYVEPTGTASVRNSFVLPETNTTSITPQKICIPGNTTKWTKENQQIEDAYTHFADWVGDMDGTYGFPYNTVDGKKKYFEADGNGGWKLVTDSNKTPWNTTGIDSSFLYQ